MNTPKPIKLTDYFDRVFVLNLDNRPDRWEEFKRRAEVQGVSGFERYRAVEGDKCPHPFFWRAGNGAWGCLMSHLRVVQDCLMDGVKNYLVLEDDALFSDDIGERLPKIMDQLKNVKWDQLYLGGQHLFVESSPPWPFREGVVRALNINRTHGFAVNRRFMAKFQQHIMHMPDYIKAHVNYKPGDENGHGEIKEWFPHIDHQLGVLHMRKENLILACDPWVCGQAASSSSVSGQENEDQWWHDKGWNQ